MNLDRDDLAARFAVAIAGGLSADSSVQTYDHGVVIEDAFDLADALIARLRPATVAQVADTPEPRRTVGAVVRWDGQQDPDEEWLLVGNKKAVALKVRRPYLLDCGTNLDGGGDYFVRWATREECERHGIPYVERGAAPSPAAGLDAPAFDEASEREAAVDIAKDRGLDVAEEVGFVAGWLARARIAAKGGA